MLSVLAMLGFAGAIETVACPQGEAAKAQSRPNVLFVSVDDLRPEIGCYGNSVIKTPSFDAFSKTGTTFMRAYCQAAVCAPSRASVMTGLRPDSTRVWDLRGKFRINLPDVVTMPQYFHEHGYHTVSMGKIFHNHMPDRVSFDEPDLRPAKYMTPEMIDREPESFYHDDEINRELAEVREQRLKKNPKRYADGWAYGRAVESFDETPQGEGSTVFLGTWLLPAPSSFRGANEVLGFVRPRYVAAGR